MAFWAFIPFIFAFWWLASGAPPTSCQKRFVFPRSHINNLTAPGRAAELHFPIFGLWGFISFYFGLVGLHSSVVAALRMERAANRSFTFLTVTNAGAQALNEARLAVEFPRAAAALARDEGLAGDPNAGGGQLVLEVGMRVRLTRNLDKQAGFVNGNTGIIEALLTREVYLSYGPAKAIESWYTQSVWGSTCFCQFPTHMPPQCGGPKVQRWSWRRSGLTAWCLTEAMRMSAPLALAARPISTTSVRFVAPTGCRLG